MSNMDASRLPPKSRAQEPQSEREDASNTKRVDKVREIDADETRKRQFQQFYANQESAETEEEQRPSPLDLMAARLKDDIRSGLKDIEEAIVPSPAYTQAPNPPSQEKPIKHEEGQGLPQSGEFWKKTDFPPEQKTQAPFVEVQGEKKKEKKGSKETVVGPMETVKQEKPERGGEKKKRRLEGGKKEEKKEEKEEKKKELHEGLGFTTHEKQEHQSGHKPHTIIGMDRLGLPAQIQPMAEAATVAASPYIQPSTQLLFCQMVGTMYVMNATKGISETEVILNNPAYAGSQFFGATIRVTKYTTAPNSFNITLSGSNAAVASFKNNIPSLMQAFQNGKFTFRVNRLDVEYETERPHFHRKEKGEGKGETK